MGRPGYDTARRGTPEEKVARPAEVTSREHRHAAVSRSDRYRWNPANAFSISSGFPRSAMASAMPLYFS
jgi:hypothetical protein